MDFTFAKSGGVVILVAALLGRDGAKITKTAMSKAEPSPSEK